MIAFFDTSAIIPLVIAEAGSARAQAAWREASRVHVIVATATEAHAALGAAHGAGRFDESALANRIQAVNALLEDCVRRDIDDDFALAAGGLAVDQQLRGYDAMQCLGALELDDEVVAVAGDRELLDAWTRLGVLTIDIAG
ncbi:PIN domain-containing protein [Agrococcus baldri]|uniref:PIN domain-containing protein n=1 Tax=Agrococcus baldri TaxID=153730 RepID=A0AA94HNM0_9MICO|nr:type II toxin-antitoxin system VapC family toxin [Agrococcus baldri]SFS15912.1 PIN domain-containing protein [Agrococcus baldri]